MPKRKRDNQELIASASDSPPLILTHDSAEALIRRLLTQFKIDPTLLEDESAEYGVGASFSKVTYAEIADRVGLQDELALKDIQTFELHRSRIPTDLFKSIVSDMDVMLMQYGPLPDHQTEEARSRFFSPIFNHLVMQFTFMLRNNPETIIEGCIGTKGRVEYFFKIFGAIAILCIEWKLKIGTNVERLNKVAQVIAECDGCDLNNAKRGFSLPIYCILCDGLSFEFFKFERTTPIPTFFRGCFPGDPEHLQRGLQVPDFTTTETSLPFILQLRCVCETIFDVMVRAYISGLKAYRERSASASKREGVKRPSLDGWDQALKSADDALATLREAESRRKDGDVDSADTNVLAGMRLLRESTGAVSTVYQSRLIMTGWDDDEVKKA